MPKEKLEGEIEGVLFHNDENDYSVLEISTKNNELITAVGFLPSPAEGEIVLLTGEYSFHKEFGRQFSFTSAEKSLPEEIDGILHYLSARNVHGIGPQTAKKIVEKFGKESFNVLEFHPEWLSDISGITPKKAAAMSKSFAEQAGARAVLMFCQGYLDGKSATKVYKRFGQGAVSLISQHPYVLCDGPDPIGFEEVDKLAKSVGVREDDPDRIYAGILYYLKNQANNFGHTCISAEDVIRESASVLGISHEQTEEACKTFLKCDKLASVKKDGTVYLMSKETENAEIAIAKKLLSLRSGVNPYSHEDIASLIQKVEILTGITYAGLQKQAIYNAIEEGVLILTGGPGTGKTTIIKALLSIFDSAKISCVLAAPTGRAAKRMSEATSHEAKTLHRLLETERGEAGESHFQRNGKNPLEEKVVIVDEASMIDLSLLYALTSALRRGTRLILIGDTDQLPSVGAGNVLVDLIESKAFRTVRLTEIFRQSGESMIVTNAHRINEGAIPDLTKTSGDFFFVRRDREVDIPETVTDLILNRLPKVYGREVKQKIQVICPSKKGNAGVEVMNKILQEKLNPKKGRTAEHIAHGTAFRVGDRVMQTANNYEMEWERDGIAGSGIFNGDIGEVLSISESEAFMKIRFDDRTVQYDFELLDDLDLAYAITVHKSQGSEYPIVILPMYRCAPMLATRNLFYTAVTRAMQMVILVGDPGVCSFMVSNNRPNLRYTALASRFAEQ